MLVQGEGRLRRVQKDAMQPAPEENGGMMKEQESSMVPEQRGKICQHWTEEERIFLFGVVNQNTLVLGESKDDTFFSFPLFSFSEEKGNNFRKFLRQHFFFRNHIFHQIKNKKIK